MTRRHAVGAMLTVAILAAATLAGGQSRETAGVITEIKLGAGTVEIRTAGGAWGPAAPLQALRAGDEVRATTDAIAVVLLSGGRGTAKMEARNSPYLVGAPAADVDQVDKARALVTGSMKFLTAGPKESPRAVLATRATARPPEIRTPRDGPVLPGALVFEWLGTQFSRYTVRLTAPSEVLLEHTGVVGARLQYPAAAPPLRPGVRYRLEVIALGRPPQATTFEIVDTARAQAVDADLRALERALGPGASPSSLAVARAGYLAEAGLFHDARLVVLAALVREPDEPVLHTVLGSLYVQTGLGQQGAEAFDEARFLMGRGESEAPSR